jgi:predicted NBD/HSP70 family sugar kinase/predicted transcriptional regulator
MRQDDLRRRNRAMVISAIRRMGTPSRTEIVSATGLSHSTISSICASLIEEGVLTPTTVPDAVSTRRGRPQIALRQDPHAATVVVASLSLNRISAALVDYSGAVLREEVDSPATAELSREDLISRLVEVAGRVIAAHAAPGDPPLRLVCSVQGVVDDGSRAMLWSPMTQHKDLRLADALERELGISADVENDCSMIALAMRSRDPLRYGRDFAAVLLSYGIGMGLVLKGDLFTGTRSSGVEFGHMVHKPEGALCRCGRRGCLEAYACDYAIWRKAGRGDENAPPPGAIREADMQELAERARSSGGREREAYKRAGEALGYGIGSLFALTDPIPVAFVGAGAAAFDLLEPALREAIAATAGGSLADQIDFEVLCDEFPLIRQGCAMQALSYVDREIFAPGVQPQSSRIA